MFQKILTRKALSGVCTKILILSIFVPSNAHAVGPTGFAGPSGRDVARIMEAEKALAPFASVVFCMEHTDQCRNTGGPDIIVLNASRRREMVEVNAAVNAAIKPENDRSGTDKWNVDVTRGDCEDYALTKRKQLIALGWSSASLRIAVALTARGEGHAVVVVKTSDGDLILDNRTNAIKDWRHTDLRILTLQSQGNPKQWYNVKHKQQVIAARVKSPATSGSKQRKAQAPRMAAEIGLYP